MYLADIISSLANGDSGLTGKFVKAKALWIRLVKDVDFSDKLQVQQLSLDVSSAQYQFEEIGGDRDTGKALMGLTCYLPFYDETAGIHEKREEAIVLFKAIQTSNVSGEIIAQAEEAAKLFFLDLED